MASPEHPDAGGKCCTRCGEWKPWDGFARSKRDADRGNAGYEASCKFCRRNYYETNRDQIAEQKRNYREANRDQIAEQKRKYRDANRDWIAERKRRYYKTNRDQRAVYSREYRKTNQDRILEKRRDYYEANRDQIAVYNREYHEKNRDDPKYRAQRNAVQRKRRALKRSLPFEKVLLREIALRDGATCWMCGDELSEWNPAHLDHLVPLSADTDQLAAWSLENPGTVRSNMALACPSCNIRKWNRIMPCALARHLRNLSAESESLDEAC